MTVKDHAELLAQAIEEEDGQMGLDAMRKLITELGGTPHNGILVKPTHALLYAFALMHSGRTTVPAPVSPEPPFNAFLED